jgi:hypothetical protein
MGYFWTLVIGFLIGSIVSYLYAAKVISKAIAAERNAAGWVDAEIHRVLDRIGKVL